MLTKQILLFGSFILPALVVHALQLTGYTSTANDRFSSGFPAAPIQNTNASFVGTGLDWSGIGWSTTTYESGSYKGFAMLSPVHFLTAQHYEYPSNANQNTIGVRVRGIDGTTSTSNGVTSLDNLGYGIRLAPSNNITDYDLAIGTLQSEATTPSNMSRIAVLDLNPSSSSNSLNAYNGLQILLCGRGSSTTGSPRIASAPITGLAINGGDSLQPYLITSQSDVQLQLGDSGHPDLHAWVNPNADSELTVLGINSAVGAADNYSSFLAVAGAIEAAQDAMEPAGYALRTVGNPSYTWEGDRSGQHITDGRNWGGNSFTNTNDLFVLFNPPSANSRSVNVSSTHNLRGLYFKSSATTSDAFTFSGTSTLTIGRGGITNYDADQQVFSADIALSTHQFWDGGSGGLSLVNLNTNGNLLELQGESTTTISGNISGSGALALSAGSLALTGTSSYTGATWAHDGTLNISGSIATSSTLTLKSSAVLTGSGIVTSIQGEGTVSPGNSPGILTSSSLDPSSGLDFDFEFTAPSAPAFGNSSASINDLLRLTSATPFENNLSAINKISIYLDVASITSGQQFLGGFYTDQSLDFQTAIQDAEFITYIADLAGSISFNGQTYSMYSGPYTLTLSTIAQSANFGSGVIFGQIMTLLVDPDQTQYAGWKLYHSLAGNDALDTADTDADGIGQLHEFALGGDPNENDLSILPTHSLVEDGGSSYLELNVTRPIGLQGISYTPRTTTDLSNWPVGSIDIANPNPTPVNNLDGTETLTYRRNQAVAEINQAYLRVEISETP